MMDVFATLRDGIDISSSWGNMEYTSWQDEQMSWKTTCYIGDWSYLDEFVVEGPDALRFLSDFAVNSFARFAIGQAKHAIFCNKAGKVIGEGVLTRHGETSFEFNSRGPVVLWLEFNLKKGGYDATASTGNDKFKFQVSGPTALAVCEKVTGQDLHDIKFMHFAPASIAGHDVMMLRQGMAGEIGFEIHGPKRFAAAVRQAILDDGEAFGIRQMGSRVAMINHLEAAFPTVTHDYVPAVGDGAEREFFDAYKDVVPERGTLDWFKSFARAVKVRGSYEGAALADWYRSPIELGWGKSVKFDHAFHGREALEDEMAHPRRQRVALVWNSEDVVAAYASMFEAGEPFDYMEMPRHQTNAMYANTVVADGKIVGTATSRGYSYFFRKMLSHAVLDVAYAEPGNAVEVIWGEPGSRQMHLRATVAPSPYKQDNRRADLTATPGD